MRIDFSQLFHHSSKRHDAGRLTPMPARLEEWPVEWRTTYYKTYPRMQKIALATTRPDVDLGDAIRRRASRRDFDRRPLSFEGLSTILAYSCGIVRTEPTISRAQASAGGRYPIEIYPMIFAGSPRIPSGLYHYDVKGHALEVLYQKPFSDDEIANLFTYPWMRNASAVIVMTALFHRSQMKYAERGYRYVLLEAGHIGQNIYLNAAALDLKCCALGGTRDENLENFLDIDGNTESVVYAVALG